MDKSIYESIKSKDKLKWVTSDSSTELIGATYIGSSYVLDQYYQGTDEFIRYMNWEERFDLDVKALWDSQPKVTDVSIDYARSLGVQRRWDWESFFSQDYVNAPEDIFSYVGSNGNVVQFTQDELELISTGEAIRGIEGHHINDVSSNIEDIAAAADPNNVELATREGHLWLHDGSWQNSTNGQTNEILTRLDIIKEGNQDQILVNEDLTTRYMPIAIATMVYMGVYGATKAIKIRNKPMSFEQKAEIVLSDMAEEGIGIAGIAIATTIASGWLESSLEGVFNSYIDTMGSFTNVGAFDQIFAMNNRFFLAATFHSTYRAFKDYRSGVAVEQVLSKAADDVLHKAKEMAVFQGVGFLADIFIPDPTGIIVAARIGWSVMKLAGQGIKYFKYKGEQKIYREVIDIQINQLYTHAIHAIEDVENRNLSYSY